MTEAQYFEIPCTRSVAGALFTQGVQDYPFSIGVPNVWHPKKSYFKVSMSLYTTGSTTVPVRPKALSAYADNAVGNLFDNVYIRGGQQDMSSIIQYAAQTSALKVRLHKSLPWLKSMGSSVAVNEANFAKRLLATAAPLNLKEVNEDVHDAA